MRPLIATMSLTLVLLVVVANPVADEQEITKTWAMTEFGEPLYAEGFERWPYVNPKAPKGGKVVLGAFGSFDVI